MCFFVSKVRISGFRFIRENKTIHFDESRAFLLHFLCLEVLTAHGYEKFAFFLGIPPSAFRTYIY